MSDSGEDLSIFCDNPALAKSFLSTVPNETKKKRRGQKKGEDELEWEKRPRPAVGDTSDEEATKGDVGLPVLKSNGKWVIERREPVVDTQPHSSDTTESDIHDGGDNESEFADAGDLETTVRSEAKDGKRSLPAKPLDFHGKRELIGEIASKIVANPEDNLDQLKRLRAFHKDSSTKIVIIAILTELAVFRDILPGYRIRQLTDKEKSVKVSKDVQKLRQYEESLVINYQHYLYFLEQQTINQLRKSARGNNDNNDNSNSSECQLLVAAFKCMCQLLESCNHFNFCDKLINSVVSGMTSPAPSGIQEMCCKAACALFEDDLHGEQSLQLIRSLGKQLKTAASGSAPLAAAVECLLSVRIEANTLNQKDKSSEYSKLGGKRPRQPKKPHVSKRKKKELKVQKEIENELKEAEAVYSQDERKRLQTESLKQIFAIYIRIIKSPGNTSAELMGAALKGLAHFAHFMGVEYFQDLLSSLSAMLNERLDQFNWQTIWQICMTAFIILSGPGDVLLIDAKEFYRACYRSLISLNERKMAPHNQKQIAEIISNCMDLMFCKRGQKVSPNRVVAFLRQLTKVALKMQDVDAIITLLNSIRRIWSRCPMKARQMLQLDDEIPVNSVGMMRDMDDPDFASYALVSSPWDLPEFLKHRNPDIKSWVQKYMKDIIQEIKS